MSNGPLGRDRLARGLLYPKMSAVRKNSSERRVNKMSIEKKSLISTLKTTKKANVASSVSGDGISKAESVSAKRANPVGVKRANPVGVKRANPVGVKRANPVGVKRANPVGVKRANPVGVKRANPVGVKRANPI